MSSAVGCRQVLDPVLLLLWHRPGARALIRPLAWELPYVVGVALKRSKKKKKKEEEEEAFCFISKNFGIFQLFPSNRFHTVYMISILLHVLCLMA